MKVLWSAALCEWFANEWMMRGIPTNWIEFSRTWQPTAVHEPAARSEFNAPASRAFRPTIWAPEPKRRLLAPEHHETVDSEQ
jgi:hypothetical protein